MANACNTKIKRQREICGFCSVEMLVLLMVMFIYPVTTNINATSDGVVAKSNVATVSVALDSEVAIDVTPTGDGTFASTPTNLTVSTNNQEGYSLYLKTIDATNNMTSPDKTQVIQAVAGTPTPSGFTNNTWGYALTKGEATSATQYAAVPTNDTKIYNEPKTTTGDTYNLTFGAKVNTELPAGQYSNSVMVSVVANPTVISNLTQVVYMQDMTAGICANTGNITPRNEVSKQLIDIRDGKQYWVSKLADQNCWMTQNLALDLSYKGSSGNTVMRTLSSADSDISVGRTWQADFPTSNEVPQPVSNPSQTEARSWNLGEYVLNSPVDYQACTTVTPTQTLEKCAQEKILTKVEGENWQSADLGSNVSVKNNQYNAHYLLGNYYAWNTATAGSAVGLVSTGAEEDATKVKNAPDSVCPANWQLPMAGGSTVTGLPFDVEKSFYRLMLAYGYPESTQYIVTDGHYGKTAVATFALDAESGENQNLILDPVYAVRSGYVASWAGGVYNVGGFGYVWTSSATSLNNVMFDWEVHRDAVYPNGEQDFKYGLPVRCVVR